MCLGKDDDAAVIAYDIVVSAVVHGVKAAVQACGLDGTAGAYAGVIVAVGLIVVDKLAVVADDLVVAAVIHQVMVIVGAEHLEEGINMTAVALMGEEVVVVIIHKTFIL